MGGDPQTVGRVDFGRLDSGSAQRTPQGGIAVPASLTRSGVFLYRNPDGTERREYRPPDEVFKSDSMATAASAPLTDLHPTDGIVTISNWRGTSVGHLGEQVRRDGELLAANVYVQDAQVVEAVERGDRRDISMGYRCRIDRTPGTTPEGERYDAIQRDIRYNHAAILPRGHGRAGDGVGLRMDSADPTDAMQVRHEEQKSAPGAPAPQEQAVRTDMGDIKVRIDGVEHRLDGSDTTKQAVEKALGDRDQRIDSLKSERDQLQAKLDEAEKKRDELQGKLDEAQDPKRLDARVQERTELIDKARRIAPELKTDGLSDQQIRCEALKAKGVEVRSDASDDYIRGRFEAVAESMPAQRQDSPGAARAAAHGAQTQTPQPEKRHDARSARDRMVQHRTQAWRGQQPGQQGA